jgi:hypothetical protein
VVAIAAVAAALGVLLVFLLAVYLAVSFEIQTIHVVGCR